jgi:SSS family solute:Na+ symporter
LILGTKGNLKEPIVPVLAPVDWLMLALDLFFMMAVALAVRPHVQTAGDYLEASRSLPGWISAVAFAAIGLGGLAPMAGGFYGSRHGLAGFAFISLGAIPALLFTGLVLAPRYYASGARTVPEFLALRFDEKTRILAAVVFVLASVAAAAESFSIAAGAFKTLRVFSLFTGSVGLSARWDFVPIVVIPAAFVLATLLLGGLRGAMSVIALQFLVLTAGFAPVTILGVMRVGWSGLKSAASGAVPLWNWGASAGTGAGGLLLAFLLGVVSFAALGSDFTVLQTVFAARNAHAARRAPLIAAGIWLVVSALVILPGMAAIGLPTPHTSTVVREENGSIFHEITVVSPAAEAGRGLVPAVTDPATRQPLKNPDGSSPLDYGKATPSLIAAVLPVGLLGLAVAALLAGLISATTAGIAAACAVFTRDLYQAHLGKAAESRHLVAVARWAAVAATLIAVAGACAALHFAAKVGDPLGSLTILLGHLCVPLFATVLAAMFLKRATGTGAFAGLVAGMIVVTLPTWFPAIPALRGVWFAWLGPHHSSGYAMTFCATIAAFAVNLAVTALASQAAEAKPQAEAAALTKPPKVEPMRLKTDLRTPMGMMFAFAGAILTAFGMATRQNTVAYQKSLGIDGNLWWGIVVLLTGIVLVQLGRRGQMRIEKGKE